MAARLRQYHCRIFLIRFISELVSIVETLLADDHRSMQLFSDLTR
jgi:hypothetical protein